MHGSLGPPKSAPETASRSVQPFLPAHDRGRQTERQTDHATSSAAIGFTMGRPFPLKIAPSYGDLDPHLIHGSLDPPESTSCTASRSVQPFFAGLTTVTERPTDRSCYSVCNNRPHLRGTAMRPKLIIGCTLIPWRGGSPLAWDAIACTMVADSYTWLPPVNQSDLLPNKLRTGSSCAGRFHRLYTAGNFIWPILPPEMRDFSNGRNQCSSRYSTVVRVR